MYKILKEVMVGSAMVLSLGGVVVCTNYELKVSNMAQQATDIAERVDNLFVLTHDYKSFLQDNRPPRTEQGVPLTKKDFQEFRVYVGGLRNLESRMSGINISESYWNKIDDYIKQRNTYKNYSLIGAISIFLSLLPAAYYFVLRNQDKKIRTRSM